MGSGPILSIEGLQAYSHRASAVALTLGMDLGAIFKHHHQHYCIWTYQLEAMYSLKSVNADARCEQRLKLLTVILTHKDTVMLRANTALQLTLHILLQCFVMFLHCCPGRPNPQKELLSILRSSYYNFYNAYGLMLIVSNCWFLTIENVSASTVMRKGIGTAKP